MHWVKKLLKLALGLGGPAEWSEETKKWDRGELVVRFGEGNTGGDGNEFEMRLA